MGGVVAAATLPDGEIGPPTISTSVASIEVSIGIAVAIDNRKGVTDCPRTMHVVRSTTDWKLLT